MIPKNSALSPPRLMSYQAPETPKKREAPHFGVCTDYYECSLQHIVRIINYNCILHP